MGVDKVEKAISRNWFGASKEQKSELADAKEALAVLEASSFKEFKVGDRVEAWWVGGSGEGQWYIGTVKELPNSNGKWKVQCDCDEVGIPTYSKHLRAYTGTQAPPAGR